MIESSITRRFVVRSVAAGIGLGAATAKFDFVGAARAQSARKTFVLVHGTFCGGWIWRRVSDLLERKGYKVFSPTNTGLGERSHLLTKDIDLDTHITDVVNVIKWESLNDVCLVVHSYGGWVGSGVVEQVGDRISSVVWLDAYKPENGQKPLDLTLDSFRKIFESAVARGDLGFAPPPKTPPIFVNKRDQAFVDSKFTAQPIGTYTQPIKLTGALEKVAKKTYIRIPKLPNPAFDRALAACKADKSWATFKLLGSGHLAMLDVPERVTDFLVQAA